MLEMRETKAVPLRRVGPADLRVVLVVEKSCLFTLWRVPPSPGALAGGTGVRELLPGRATTPGVLRGLRPGPTPHRPGRTTGTAMR